MKIIKAGTSQSLTFQLEKSIILLLSGTKSYKDFPN